MKPRRPLFAALLSGLFPGLGQLYNQDLVRAALFLGGGVFLLYGPIQPLSVPIDLGDPGPGLAKVLLESVPFLVLTAWSVVDAYRRAGREPSRS